LITAASAGLRNRVPVKQLRESAGRLSPSRRHIDCGKDTAVTILLLAMLDRAGVRRARLGDSIGLLEI
jgi:hypothetical protein